MVHHGSPWFTPHSFALRATTPSPLRGLELLSRQLKLLVDDQEVEAINGGFHSHGGTQKMVGLEWNIPI